ncbi:hypothetical protein LPB03_12130 [Polaribacter vadi]|uniref:Thiol:disulfide interchange protein DsbD N-terminal domain-containing protein n=1 Tax=Polaribacter vadi TaxID=1774273 RepID=A0A1B8TTM7_9FLAO|nr:protein-disulfide reductase DsbD domain-containing protein [Polaribacter vadi]AOW18155.1 hypothetical protein LPB03_12130 [Polaribacter vadi]OBY62884.1 hypothetical protein LPB3_12145 [Polaribacter vadi]
MFYKAQIIVTVWLLLITTVSHVEDQTRFNTPVSYTIEAPEKVRLGERFVITVAFSIEPSWYLYAPIAINTDQGRIPTKVTFKIPNGLKIIGELELPDQNRFYDTYSGDDVRMSQEFQVEKNISSGKQTIKANIIYQTCNDEICYPPVRKTIDIIITVE